MIGSVISGILAGYIASRIQKGKGSGCWINLFLGVAGGIVGGWLFRLLGIQVYTWAGELVMSVIGAALLLWLFSALRK